MTSTSLLPKTTSPSATSILQPDNTGGATAISASLTVTIVTGDQRPTSIPAPTSAAVGVGNKGGISHGARVGIVIGAVLIIGVLLAIVLYILWYRKRKIAVRPDIGYKPDNQIAEPYGVPGSKFNYSIGSRSLTTPIQEIDGKSIISATPAEMACEEARGSREKFLLGAGGRRASDSVSISVEASESSEKVFMVEDKCLRRDML
jgi:hypothetical protein